MTVYIPKDFVDTVLDMGAKLEAESSVLYTAAVWKEFPYADRAAVMFICSAGEPAQACSEKFIKVDHPSWVTELSLRDLRMHDVDLPGYVECLAAALDQEVNLVAPKKTMGDLLQHLILHVSGAGKNEWNQKEWILPPIDNVCGTQSCIAGEAVLFANPDFQLTHPNIAVTSFVSASSQLGLDERWSHPDHPTFGTMFSASAQRSDIILELTHRLATFTPEQLAAPLGGVD